ncbi:MAG: cation transporter [Flavobacteriales bacterium]|nr:cation transporter [Flavobacteriales bacterium]
MSENIIITVEGMNCGHCSNAVKNLIEELEGVESAEVNLGTKEANVLFDPKATNTQAIIDNINSSETYKATQK